MVYLVYGSPCSGKSTYIKEHKKSGDIVCDVDRLYSAVSLNEEHKTELYAHEVANMLYDEMLAIIRERKGHWKNAFVVSLANTDEKLKRIKELVDADECVYIDTPMDECIRRAEERPFFFSWIIEDWFENRSFKHE